jgi:predicted enzyme related to lactoylglutathione lyase
MTTASSEAAGTGEHPHTHATMPAGHCHLGLTVPDLDGFHNEMVAKGVKCVQGPKKEDFGTLAIYADPDGLPFSASDAT